MRHTVQVELIERLLAGARDAPARPPGRAERETCGDPARADEERAAWFRELPLAVAHASEVTRPGDFMTAHVADTAVLLVRDQDDTLRAFVNLCRHRGAPLAHHTRGQGCKTLVCPYHGWVYGLTGELVHVPGEAFFPDLDRAALGLVPLPVACAHGFVWVVPDAERGARTVDVAGHLDAIDDDLTHFDLAGHALYRKSERVRACDWTLLIDAFVERYPTRESLHRDSSHRSSGNAVAVCDRFGRHVRSVGALENLDEHAGGPREEWDIRACTTLLYLLFPNTVLVVHPDFLTVLTVLPIAVDRCLCTHYMLVPERPDASTQTAHWERSFELIDRSLLDTRIDWTIINGRVRHQRALDD